MKKIAIIKKKEVLLGILAIFFMIVGFISYNPIANKEYSKIADVTNYSETKLGEATLVSSNEVVENVKIDYYYARKSDAKKAYEKNNEYNFFNENSILNENILSKDITKIYSNMSKDKILEAIKSNIEL